MSPSASLQDAMRAALVADPAMTALVAADHIYERHKRLEDFPCVVIGEVHEIADDLTLERNTFRLFPTLHIWVREPGLNIVKEIAWQVRRTLLSDQNVRLGLIDWRYDNARFLRDPDGVTSHGVISFEALLAEVRP